jgi:hypothetical protein
MNLDQSNIKYFKQSVSGIKKDTQQEVSANCPACGDKKHRLHLYATEVGDLVHCFNSGCELAEKHHTMVNFLKIINSPLLNSYKREKFQTQLEAIKESNTLDSIVSEIKEKRQKSPSPPSPPRTNEKEIPKLLLDKFQKCKDNEDCFEYVLSRGLTPECDWLYSTDRFFEYGDKKVFLENFLIVPIYKNNKFKGWYSRSIKEKQFSTFLLPNAEKIWYRDSGYPDFPTTTGNLYFFEGVFDALSTNFSNSASMLGADLSETYIKLLDKNSVFVFDNDTTGIKKAIKYAKLGFGVFVWPEIDYKDLNELLQKGVSKEQITELIKKNTHRGIMAEAKLKLKEK